MDIDQFKVKDFLPFYLTEDQKVGLADAVKGFSGRSDIYTQGLQDQVLQGDCWQNIPFIDIAGRRGLVSVMLLSNSCDIAPENDRDLPVNVTYAPLIDLAKYEGMLLAAKVPEPKLREKIAAIRAQKITSLIYLPALLPGAVERVVMLDKAMSVPYKVFEEQADKRKLFSLNQLGFYLLSFKLSIHFCRMHERVDRGLNS